MWLFFALSSCVPKGSYELVEVQLDATRTALSAKNAACYQDIEAREERIALLEEQLRDLERKHSQLEERHTTLTGELADARNQMAALATKVPAPKDDPINETEALVKASADTITSALWFKSQADYQAEQRQLEHKVWQQRFDPLIQQGHATIVEGNGQTIVRIPSARVFNEGRISISPLGETVVTGIADALRGMRGRRIQIVAHTDDAPYHTAEFDSQWERGFAQAMTVLRALDGADVPVSLSAATFAGTQPLTERDTEQGRKLNSRIELVVWRDLSQVPGVTGTAVEMPDKNGDKAPQDEGPEEAPGDDAEEPADEAPQEG